MSVQTDIEARAAKLREILIYSNAALIAKDGTGVEDLSGLPAAIQALPDADPELQDLTVTENGIYYADAGYDGLGIVTVEVESEGGGNAIPEPYATYIAEAEEVYTGEYANVIYAEGYGTISEKTYHTVMFLLDNWTISAYDAATSGYTHGGFIMVQKEDDGAWEVTDYSSTTTDTHYAKNIKAASCYIEYEGLTLFPVGLSGESGGGGGTAGGPAPYTLISDLVNGVGTLPDDFIAWVKSIPLIADPDLGGTEVGNCFATVWINGLTVKKGIANYDVWWGGAVPALSFMVLAMDGMTALWSPSACERMYSDLSHLFHAEFDFDLDGKTITMLNVVYSEAGDTHTFTASELNCSVNMEFYSVNI